jgi:hypothetical protein
LKTRTIVRKIARSLQNFAKSQGWQPGEYQIFFHILEDWGRISVLFIVKDFGSLSENELWVHIWDHLAKSLKEDGDIGYSLGLSVRDQQQVEQGGIYSIPDEYREEDVLFGSGLSN